MNRGKHTRHGWVGTRTYNAWKQLRRRCRDPNTKCWKNYGGRGITVCERWDDFLMFLEDMGPAPTNGHSIDRIDNNGHYVPENCKWSTPWEQQHNKRPSVKTVWLTFRGQTLSVTEWAKIVDISRFNLYERIKAGWDIESTLTRKPWSGVSPGGWRTM